MQKNLDNIVTLTGFITSEVMEISDIYGLPYNGWVTVVETERTSGAKDEAIIAMPRETAIKNMKIGTAVMVIGKMQTSKDFSTGKVLVYVLAEYAAPIEGEYWERQNEVMITGRVRGIKYRVTPKGKQITDIILIVPNLVKGKNCYIPCICWQEQADKVKGWDEGTKATLRGRLQSRTYIKRLDDGSEEERICFEVSASSIERGDEKN